MFGPSNPFPSRWAPRGASPTGAVVLVLALVCQVLWLAHPWETGLPAPAITESDGVAASRVGTAYGQLPLSFEPAAATGSGGEAGSRVKFISRGSGYTLFLTSTGAMLSLQRVGTPEEQGARKRPAASSTLQMELVGASGAATVAGAEELPGKVNYLTGNDPSKWRTDVPTYARVRYTGVYPGVDMVYYGKQRQLEYDFIVAPGADPRDISLKFMGAARLELNGSGDLVLHTPGGKLTQHKPYAYQTVGGVRREVESRYVLDRRGQVGFALGAYDRTLPLVIDPLLTYSTYLGGGGDDAALDIAIDGYDNAYITGFTASPNFPTGPVAYDSTKAAGADAFITKLNATGTRLIYSTFVDGSNEEAGLSIAVDRLNFPYITGYTNSTNYPTTLGAYDRSYNGGGFDAFVTKLRSNGKSLFYSTYLGGGGAALAGDGGTGITVDYQGAAYVTGFTDSSNFPAVRGSHDLTYNGGGDAFVAKFAPRGGSLTYSTFLGGPHEDSAGGIALGPGNNAYVTGDTASAGFPTTPGAYDRSYNGAEFDAFVTRLTGSGGLSYSTFLGGNALDFSNSIAVDAAGNAHVTGATVSSGFPTTPGAYDRSYNGAGDAYVTKLTATGGGLLYSTFLGGSGSDVGMGIAVGRNNRVRVTGDTDSLNFPTTSAPRADKTYNGGNTDAFVSGFFESGSALTYSSYLGGADTDTGSDVALDSAGRTHVTGTTGSNNFPTTSGAHDRSYNGGGFDAFVTEVW